MKGQVYLPKTSLRGFPPRTYGEADVQKKIQVRDLLRPKIDDLPSLQQLCRGNRLWLGVTFLLLAGTTVESRTGKDIDNLLKIVMDTLPEYMDRARMHEGLGLILEDKDDMIYEVHAEKTLVGSDSEEGIDIEIAQWVAARPEH